MTNNRPLFIPVILGTPRQGRYSEHVARFVLDEVSKQESVETELIDIRAIALPTVDAGEAVKDSGFSELVERADALIIVAPEYNHGYPGLLKHVLDSNLKEYIHKAVGICGVSAGPFGGTRVVENLLPVMRELGLVTIFWDGNFSSVQKVFDESGALLDESYVRRIDKFLKELIWMAKVLRYGRENVALESAD
jgi:NAD(P)H-dependent FMN reductase